MNLIARMNSAPAVSFVSPLRELGAYEALWDKPETTFKTLSEKFAARRDALPSDFVPEAKARECAEFVRRRFREADVTRYGVRVHGAGEYPQKLRDAAHPIEFSITKAGGILRSRARLRWWGHGSQPRTVSRAPASS
jgi:DNA processing protein